MNIHPGDVAITGLATFRSLLSVYMFLMYWKMEKFLRNRRKTDKEYGERKTLSFKIQNSIITLSILVATLEMTVLMLIEYMNTFPIPRSSRAQPKYLTNFLMVFHALFERL